MKVRNSFVSNSSSSSFVFNIKDLTIDEILFLLECEVSTHGDQKIYIDTNYRDTIKEVKPALLDKVIEEVWCE